MWVRGRKGNIAHARSWCPQGPEADRATECDQRALSLNAPATQGLLCEETELQTVTRPRKNNSVKGMEARGGGGHHSTIRKKHGLVRYSQNQKIEVSA